MNRRFLALLVTVAAVVADAASVAGQAPAWTPPLGPDGHPDLQGIWLNNSATPLERPKALEGRQSLTDEEVVELRRRADRLFKNTNADFAAGDAVFLAALADIDRFKSATSTGTTFEMIEREFDNRTSLIVDPADGRIPCADCRSAAESGRRSPRFVGVQPEGPEDLNQIERCSDLWCAEAQRKQHRRRSTWLLRDRANAFVHHAVSRGDTRSTHRQPGRATAPAAVGPSMGRGFPGTMGGDRRSSSTPPTSCRRATSWGRRTTCIWSNDSHASRPIESTIRSPSTIRPRGRSPGRLVIRLKQSAERLYRVRLPRRQLRNPPRHLRWSARRRKGAVNEMLRLLRQGEREERVAGRDRDVLAAVDRKAHRRGLNRGAERHVPQVAACLRVERDEIALSVAGEHQSAGGGEHAGPGVGELRELPPHGARFGIDGADSAVRPSPREPGRTRCRCTAGPADAAARAFRRT